MDYRNKGNQEDWYEDSIDSDAQFAAQLQRQFDDEDLLTSQLASTFNFGQRPGLEYSRPETSNNLKNDEEIARRLQRKFFMDMKQQGFSEIDIASMLDSLTPDYRQLDTEFNQAVRASMGEDQLMEQIPPPQTTQSFMEKFLMTLYSNCRYESDAKAPPHPSDDFSMFREQASKSIKTMLDEVLIDVQKIVEIMLDKVLNVAQSWDEVEAALFIIDSVSHQMNTTSMNDQNARLIRHITSLHPNSNPLLIGTATRLISNLSHWLYINKPAAVTCVNISPLQNCLLNSVVGDCFRIFNLGVNLNVSYPPHESFLLGIGQVLEKLTGIMHVELAQFFKPILDLIPCVELTTDNGAEMEEAAQSLIRSCIHLVNDLLPPEQMVASLQALLNRPMYALNQLASSGNLGLDEPVASCSWHALAVDPKLWLQRIYHIFKTLHPWDAQSDYFNLKFNSECPVAPWSSLSREVCQVICQVMEAYSNDQNIVERCCQTCIQVINCDLSNNAVLLVDQLLTELLSIYTRQPQSYVLQSAGSVIEEYTVGINAEETIGHFLNSICIQTDVSIDQVIHSPQLIQSLFSVVNLFTRLRMTSFVNQPAAQLMFELSIFALGVEEYEVHKYARSFIFMFLQFPRNQTSDQLISVVQSINMIMGSCFGKLVDTCLRISLFETSVEIIGTVAEVLSELLLYEGERMDEYLRPAIERLVSPYHVSMDRIRAFESNLKSCLNVDDVLNSLVSFSRILRN